MHWIEPRCPVEVAQRLGLDAEPGQAGQCLLRDARLDRQLPLSPANAVAAAVLELEARHRDRLLEPHPIVEQVDQQQQDGLVGAAGVPMASQGAPSSNTGIGVSGVTMRQSGPTESPLISRACSAR